MTKARLTGLIRQKKSFLCVGLDTDLQKIPSHLLSETSPALAFNKAIIDATRDYCVAYKINTAFYEAMGVKGWEVMEATVNYIGKEHFIIADAKRGDIGNTADQYARAFFETLPFDAITIAPYMGRDSVEPFLQYPGKWAIVLGLTSNPGAADFELQPAGDELLYEKVLRTVSSWGSTDNLMFVAGATQAGAFTRIRERVPRHFLLVPGVGAQGGSLKEIAEKAMNEDVGLLVNASRAVIYADKGPGFSKAAADAARAYAEEMAGYL